MNMTMLSAALDAVQETLAGVKPHVAVVLGSGWGDVIEGLQVETTIDYAVIPGLGATGVAGHAGRLLHVSHAVGDVLIFQGRRHGYEGEGWEPIATPVYVARSLGADTLLITNAAGGIRESLQPGSLMIIRDHINFMGSNPLVGAHDPFWGPRFPDQSSIYTPELQALIERVAQANDIEVEAGTYVAASGPTYETPAEIRMFREWGGDAIGMSTVPEAMLANAAGMRVAGISCISNAAAGVLDAPLAHEEVIASTQAAMPRMRTLLRGILDGLAST